MLRTLKDNFEDSEITSIAKAKKKYEDISVFLVFFFLKP